MYMCVSGCFLCDMNEDIAPKNKKLLATMSENFNILVHQKKCVPSLVLVALRFETMKKGSQKHQGAKLQVCPHFCDRGKKNATALSRGIEPLTLRQAVLFDDSGAVR